jgi:hypothetical protein
MPSNSAPPVAVSNVLVTKLTYVSARSMPNPKACWIRGDENLLAREEWLWVSAAAMLDDDEFTI